jgi:hypothetical protein
VKLRDWIRDLCIAREMQALGVLAFGPTCIHCGRPDWRYMPDHHYAYANRISKRENGRPLSLLAGLCQCGPDTAEHPIIPPQHEGGTT